MGLAGVEPVPEGFEVLADCLIRQAHNPLKKPEPTVKSFSAYDGAKRPACYTLTEAVVTGRDRSAFREGRIPVF